MPITIEEIISKINKIFSKELDKEEAKELLEDIDVDLRKLKKSVEKKHKKIVEGKIKQLRKIVDESLEEELSWTETQDVLGKVKKGLNELKEEIRKLEEKLCIRCKDEISSVKKTLYGYVTKNYWGGDTIGQPSKAIFLCRKCSELEEKDHQLEANFRDEMFRNDNEGYAGGGVVGIPKEMNISAKEAFQEKEIREEINVVGGLGGMAGGSTQYGAHLVKDMDIIGTRKDAKDFTENVVKTGADTFENTRKGAQEVTEKVIGNFDILGAGKKLADSLGSSIGAAEKAKARIEEIEDLKNQLEELKKEKEKQIERLEKQLQKKDDKIEKLENKIEKLEEVRDELIAQIEVKK